MANIAIKVQNLSKAYQLGEIGTGTISRDLARWYAGLRGKEDPFLKIGETNNRAIKGESNVVWSLKDINFEIEQGTAVGIIGNNGAGKSTLLKILSKVTAPTSGSILGKGRIASLLEVGTGFNPELSGRENIFLNGAILGMRKKEIERKFDEIVDFAGVERYVDTPVKRYSSGMYVRLAFAVAANLESEILIVDEVLAVGDAEFQKKCLGKMNAVSKGEGRTVLFVSHNMNSIQKLCSECIVLNNGTLLAKENTKQAIAIYQNSQQLNTLEDQKLDENYTISNITFLPDPLHSLSNCELQFEIASKENRKIESIVPLIFDTFNQRVAILDLRNEIGVNIEIAPNENLKINIKIKKIPLLEGEYVFGVHINDNFIATDFSDLYRFNVWPAQNNKDEIAYEYDIIHRGFMNFDFEVANKSDLKR
jgi:lipopolysaccharide transport system ATP-binding protein